ncbi:hypothetical protein [Alkalihalophilus marmarensis]|uniref:hypothetical protein n=1 Tax=Alkalihalophilus marmarensis TaxID=521377 RepID=UPI002E22F7F9|nr:hypothetical protein [Alkalihalophilus marmarensis]
MEFKTVRTFFIGGLCLLLAACSSATQPMMTQEELVNLIYEETGEKMYLPKFEALDVSYVYVQYDEADHVRSIDVQYAEGRTSEIIDYFQNPINTAAWEEQHHAKKLYGPYEGEVAFMLSYSKEGVTSTQADKVVELEEVEVGIQEDMSFTIHSVSFRGEYRLAYNNDYVTEEEALEHTHSYLMNVE